MLGVFTCTGGGAALKLETSRIVETNTRRTERVIRSAQAPEELFFRFFIFFVRLKNRVAVHRCTVPKLARGYAEK